MAWTVEFEKKAARELKKLSPDVVTRILDFLVDRVESADDPRQVGAALRGPDLGRFWKYRVGDYRLIAHIDDVTITVLILSVGHRRQIYR